VREGRRREFAHFAELRDAAARERLPDPTRVSTFEKSRLDWREARRRDHVRWLARYRRILAIRRREIMPRLRGMAGFSGGYRVLCPNSVIVEWRLGDGSRLRLIANFGGKPIAAQDIGQEGRVLYASVEPPGASRSAAFLLLPQ
jgi:1,4-alpha-glucan branching enzyme